MALLADGLHMGSHTVALGITAFAYLYARRHAHDQSFSFGTGKVYALAAFSSAILLTIFALMMVRESVNRFFNPVVIIFNLAIVVAIIGLAVNALCVLILGERIGRDRHPTSKAPVHSDHNLRAAYLHVLADALTSFLAIFALLAGKFLGLVWMDPLMGIIGAILVARWSWDLLKDTSNILLDKQTSPELKTVIKEAIEQKESTRIADLHVWSIGPEIYAVALSIVTSESNSPEYYKSLLPTELGLVHTTIEVHECKHSQDHK
jgi:cation diffusion facilitator family transporter